MHKTFQIYNPLMSYVCIQQKSIKGRFNGKKSINRLQQNWYLICNFQASCRDPFRRNLTAGGKLKQKYKICKYLSHHTYIHRNDSMSINTLYNKTSCISNCIMYLWDCVHVFMSEFFESSFEQGRLFLEYLMEKKWIIDRDLCIYIFGQ